MTVEAQTIERAEAIKNKLLKLIVNDLEGTRNASCSIAPFFQNVRLSSIRGDYINNKITVLLVAPNGYVRNFICHEWETALHSSVVSCLHAFYNIGVECEDSGIRSKHKISVEWILDK